MEHKKIQFPNTAYLEKQEQLIGHFAKGLNFYKLFWIFFIGSILGVVIEVVWCIGTRGVYESRVGLIYGPFNLVYGFGALAMGIGLYWMRGKRDLSIFCGGIIIGSIIEYVCSFVQEYMFGSISWDYANFPFNLNGRINLLYSFFWGLLAIVWIKGGYPLLMSWIIRIPNKIGKVLTWLLLLFMIFNTVMSTLAVERWTMRREGIEGNGKLWNYFDTYYPNEKMEDIFPNMVFLE